MKHINKKHFLIVCIPIIIISIIAVMIMNHKTVKFTLNGDKNMELIAGEEFKDPGITARDGDEDLTNLVKISSIDTKKIGTQTITYTMIYNEQEYSLSREVEVKDSVAPTIKLNGGETVEWKKGVTYKELGYNVFDNLDAKANLKVQIHSSVDTTKVGTYDVVYSTEDSSGNKTEVTRKVEVKDSVKMASDTGVPVCMYHYLYETKPSDADANSMSIKSFKEQLDYLVKNNYYFVSYSELREFVDKKRDLPAKSIIISFDDGAKSTLPYLKQISEEYELPITSFVITSKDGENKIKKTKNNYMIFESHSHNMHRGGGKIGHGGIFTALSKEDAIADMKKSVAICGSNEAFCYPFGDYTDACAQYVEEAGFKVAFTTQPGKVKQGMNPYLLPRIRMSGGISLSGYKSMIN